MFPLRDELPSNTRPVVTWGLIAANVACFLWQLAVQSGLESQITPALSGAARASDVNPLEYLYFLWLREHGLVPALIVEAPLQHAWTVVMGIFLHGGWLHLLGNVWFLYVFGDNIEDRMGHNAYLAFYLGCGVAASAAQVAADPTSTVPIIGASGAIAGVLGAYLVLYPKARIVTVIPIVIFLHVVRLPAVVFLGIWLVLQNLLPVSQAAEDGVAYWAHIGGFAAGAGWVWLRRDTLLPGSRPKRRYRGFDRDGYW